MKEMSDLKFKKKVMLKLIASGVFVGMTVTWKSGTFTYLLPKWVHRLHLQALMLCSQKWCDTVVELLKNPKNE